PVEPVRGQMLLYRAAPELLQRIVLHQGHYFIPRRDGHILVGSTMEYVGFNKETTPAAAEELHGVITEVMPKLLDYPQVLHWAGLRPGIADGIPLIGPVEGIDGLYLNTGHFRNGVVMGYASSRLLASLMLQQSANVPTEEYLPTAGRLRRING
ncbi:MAG TPA: FAD-dependent oxidoreductase, partial [Gammaproteobacteria bacterium]